MVFFFVFESNLVYFLLLDPKGSLVNIAGDLQLKARMSSAEETVKSPKSPKGSLSPKEALRSPKLKPRRTSQIQEQTPTKFPSSLESDSSVISDKRNTGGKMATWGKKARQKFSTMKKEKKPVASPQDLTQIWNSVSAPGLTFHEIS